MVSDNVKIGIVPVMISLYERLIPSLKEKLNQITSKVIEQFADYKIETVSADVSSTVEQIQSAIVELEKQDVDILVIGNISYCESGVIYNALKDVDLPILLWPIQEMYEVIPEEFDAETLTLNHGVHGTQDVANILQKNDVPFGVIHGHYQQESFITELIEWARAGRILQAMKKSNPLQIGGWFENMLDLQVDNAEFVEKMNLNISRVSADEFAQSLKNISQSDITGVLDTYKEQFTIANDVSGEMLEKAARNECALRKIISKKDSKAVGVNFLTLANHPDIADGLHIAASRLMSENVGYGGEGDFITAMLVRGLLAISNEVTFTEIFSVDYANDRLVLRHWGEGNINIARSRPRVIASKFNDKIEAEFAVSDFEFKSGSTAIVNLNADKTGGGKLTVIAGTVIDEHLPKIKGPRAIFKPDMPKVTDVLNKYAYAGGSHHLAMIYVDSLGMFEKLTRLAGWDLCVVGAE